uniref:POM121 transmembrane nucleoporin C n=1 Tax=Strigops habroptila TaxID=2489341 RepID=A0A672UD98_STRHB
MVPARQDTAGLWQLQAQRSGWDKDTGGTGTGPPGGGSFWPRPPSSGSAPRARLPRCIPGRRPFTAVLLGDGGAGPARGPLAAGLGRGAGRGAGLPGAAGIASGRGAGRGGGLVCHAARPARPAPDRHHPVPPLLPRVSAGGGRDRILPPLTAALTFVSPQGPAADRAPPVPAAAGPEPRDGFPAGPLGQSGAQGLAMGPPPSPAPQPCDCCAGSPAPCMGGKPGPREGSLSMGHSSRDALHCFALIHSLTQQILARNFQDKSSPDPCAKETVLSAIKECRKRPLQQEDDQALGIGKVVNGVSASVLTNGMPEAMKRDLDSHHPEECSKSHISSPSKTYTAGILGSERNAIASSYSSSRGLPQVGNVLPKAAPQPSAQLFSFPHSALASLLGGSIRAKGKTKSLCSLSLFADSTGAAVVSQPLSSAAQLPVPALSLELSSLPATSADTKPVPVLSTSALTVPVAPSGTTPPTFTELGQTPSKPPSFPKPSILFGTPDTPPSNQLAMTAGAAAPTTTPVFKPIFGESSAPSAAVVSTTVTMSVSSGPSSTSSTTTMFKPIFGSVITASAPVNTSPFAFQPSLQPASASELPAASTATLAGFTGLPNVIFTTAAMTATTESSFTDATIKPVFSFGLNTPASTSPTTSLTITTATATSMSQPFLFGGPATSAPSTEISFATPGSMLQFGKPTPATVAATTSVPGGPAFGQVPSNLMAPATTVGFSIFGGTTLTSSTPATTSQVTLTFGSPASAFGSCAGAAESQPPSSQPAAGPGSFAPQFSFGAPPAQLAAQPTFGSSAQPAFGTASAQGSFGTSSTQAAFGTTTSVFSFGTATSTTASFGSTTQTTSSSSTGAAIFGTTPSPFTFGVTAQPGPSTSAFGVGTPALSSGSPAVAFSFGAGQSGAALAATPFGSSLAQSALGAQSQSTPFAFTMPSTPNSKPVFGGSPAPTFGQSTPVPGAVGSGSSSLSFRTPSTPASGFGGVGTSFGSSTPAFSIGAGSKAGARQRLQARRQHTRKK